MKVIQVPFSFYPDPVTGADLHVGVLSQQLLDRGVQVAIAVSGKESPAAYWQGRIPVHFLSGNGDGATFADALGRLLDAQRPDLIHLHGFSVSSTLYCVDAAKRRGIRVVFTYFIPRVSCFRGTLMRWGKEACSGELDVTLCSRCILQSRGIPRRFVGLADRISAGAGKIRKQVSIHHMSFHLLMSEVDQVVVHSRWSRELLVRNGVPEEKITLSPHGLTQQTEQKEGSNNFPGNQSAPTSSSSPSVRMAFLGRLSPDKGAHQLLQAFQKLPNLEACLDLYCFNYKQGEQAQRWAARLKRLAASDPRIRFCEPIPSEGVLPLLRGYDLLVVPSQWMEVGPLVVLEAFAAGIPVLGSNLGGIAELVRDEVDGLLVDPFDVRAWERALRRVVEDRDLLARLKSGVRSPRGMDEVTEDMEVLYRRLVGSPRTTEVLPRSNKLERGLHFK